MNHKEDIILINSIRNELIEKGASLVGFAGLDIIDKKIIGENKIGISIGIALNPFIINGIKNGPTTEYYHEYENTNNKLDELSLFITKYINNLGYGTKRWGATNDGIYGHHMTDLPHKTMATLSGLGWIGKCALLITKEFGSAIRFTTVLANININVEDNSISESYCKDCDICVKKCPGKAPKGINWHKGLFRDKFFDPDKCRLAARKLAKERTNIEDTFCGICIATCLYTQKYIENEALRIRQK